MSSMNPLNKTVDVGKPLPITPRKDRMLYLWAKRTLDISLSLIGLIFLCPVFLAVALLIKLEDPKGAVFFSQVRVGRGGTPFKMYKFRSMVSGAELMLGNLIQQSDVTGAMFKMKNDPRVTRVGRFIRKTSMDELPQLVNVLKGNMSLVGPRPPLPREVSDYTSYDMQRLLVVPGCTGLWQVSGRNHVGFQEMVELDLKYINEQSIWMDMIILCKTVKVLFGADNAY